MSSLMVSEEVVDLNKTFKKFHKIPISKIYWIKSN